MSSSHVRAHFGFNTGRLYNANGQEIEVVEFDSGDVYFKDHSRLITGWFHREPSALRDALEVTPSYVMHQYDRYTYEMRAPSENHLLNARSAMQNRKVCFGSSLRL